MTGNRRLVHLLHPRCVKALALAAVATSAGCGATGSTTTADRAGVPPVTSVAATTAANSVTTPAVGPEPALTYDAALSVPAVWLGIDVTEQQLAPGHPDVEPGNGTLRAGAVSENQGRTIRGVVAPGGWFDAPVAGEYRVHYSFGPSLCDPDVLVDRTLQIPAPGRYSLPSLADPFVIACADDTPLQDGMPAPGVLALVTGPETDDAGTVFQIANYPLGGS